MTRTRLLFAPLMALALSTPLGSAPQARYDYYLTGSPANIIAGAISSTQPGGSIY